MEIKLDAIVVLVLFFGGYDRLWGESMDDLGDRFLVEILSDRCLILWVR
ncbi:MAG: hypothetical protein NW214_08980 [Pseudanabaenaceae cyanobacterium bins.39]|nr:hypothetical protein [Pseudanabaenaceae cyanobacterium bins.39]